MPKFVRHKNCGGYLLYKEDHHNAYYLKDLSSNGESVLGRLYNSWNIVKPKWYCKKCGKEWNYPQIPQTEKDNG